MYEKLCNIAIKYDLDLSGDFYRFSLKGKNKNYNITILWALPELYNRVIRPYDNLKVFRFIMNTWSGSIRGNFSKAQYSSQRDPGKLHIRTMASFSNLLLADRAYFYDEPFYMNRRIIPTPLLKTKKVFAFAMNTSLFESFVKKRAAVSFHACLSAKKISQLHVHSRQGGR